jgi:CubicO group peptidase (beta-lactamase class C family)
VEKDQAPEPAPYLEEGAMNAAGGLYSTVEDMARFVALQFRDGPAGAGQILAGATLREMRAPVFLAPDWKHARGIGWLIERVADHTAVGHSGGIPGYGTNVMLVPALEVGAIVFCNAGADAAALSRGALEVLVPVLARRRARAEAAAAPALPEDWQRYAGRYLARFLGIEVKPVKGRLAIVFPDAPADSEVTLAREREHLFRTKDGELVGFEVDDAGRANLLRTGGGVFRRAEEPPP